MVPYPRVTGLVRQLTHDVRNGLNNIDLQAALLQELVADPQVAPEIKRLRGMVSDTAKWLQDFSRTFWSSEPHLVTYSAAAFVEDFRSRMEKKLPQLAPHIRWSVSLPEGKMLVVELIEPKSSVPSAPETWGLEPLVSTRRSGFGMGLFQARQIIDLHGGEMTFTFDQTRQRLTTRVALPLAAR